MVVRCRRCGLALIALTPSGVIIPLRPCRVGDGFGYACEGACAPKQKRD